MSKYKCGHKCIYNGFTFVFVKCTGTKKAHFTNDNQGQFMIPGES